MSKNYTDILIESIITEAPDLFDFPVEPEVDDTNIDDTSIDDTAAVEDTVDDADNPDQIIKSLEEINDSIGADQVTYETLRAFFNIQKQAQAAKANNSRFSQDAKELLKTIWHKLFRIAGKMQGGQYKNFDKDYGVANSTIMKIQYAYNAYITENYLHNKFGWAYATSDADHTVFHAGTVVGRDGNIIRPEDIPDFKNVPLNLSGVNLTCGVEVKNYGTISMMSGYLLSENRKPFHSADYILVFVMANKQWYLQQNRADSEPIQVTDSLETPDGLIKLSFTSTAKDGNDIKYKYPLISDWA